MALLSGELGGEEGPDQLGGEVRADDPAAEAKDVGVVVLDRLMSGVRVVGEGGSHPGQLVGSNGGTGPRPTHDDAPLDFATAHRIANCRCVVRVVDGIFGIGPQIHNRQAVHFQQLDEGFLQCISRMIGTDRYSHVSPFARARVAEDAGEDDGRPRWSAVAGTGNTLTRMGAPRSDTDRIVVRGGRRLEGQVSVYGAKNAALKHLVVTLLAPGVHRLRNVPGILDVEIMGKVLEHAGATCVFDGHEVTIDVPEDLRPETPLELVRQMRASILVLGPLLARCGTARVAMPGGDDLGARPINMHLDGLRRLGAEFELSHGVLKGWVDGKLKGAQVDLDYPSVGATENVLLGAVTAQGETIIDNAAREPEIEDVARLLAKMGAKVEGAGTSTIRVLGVDRLTPAIHDVIPDRLEAGTFAVAGAITGGVVRVTDCVPDHLRMELRKLEAAGCEVERGDDWFEVRGPDRLRAVDFATLPYPGFHTDLHPPFVAMLAIAEGTSVITENLYDSRFRYIGELARMGADISREWQHAVIRGVDRLSGCPVQAPDIRAGAALVLAGLRAEGQTTIHDVSHIDRGYEDFTGRLRQLGADIDRHP